MKKMNRMLFVFVSIFCLLQMNESRVFAADYDTRVYNVNVNVNKDQSYDITEAIHVNFTYPKHGIYRYIPYVGEIHSKVDGKEVDTRYKSKIKNLEVQDFEYETENENGNKIVKIGDEDTRVSGKQTYRLSYKYKMYDDGVKDYDQFYLNVIPTGWETEIEKADVVIQMPKSFNKDKIEVFSGKYGESLVSKVPYTVKGNKIHIKTENTLEQGTGITVRILLPDGYFEGVPNDTVKNIFLGVLGVLTIAALILLWYRFGKDRYYVKTVEFYPPEGMTPAELGYIIDGRVDKQDVISLIMYHAQKGYLTIEEEKKGKKPSFILHKQKNLPTDAKKFEKTFFDGIFAKAIDGTVHLDDLGDDFYQKFSDTKEDISISFEDYKENNIFEKSANYVRYIAMILVVVGYGLGAFLASQICGDMEQILLFVIALIPFLGAIFFACETIDKRYVSTKGKKIFHGILTILLTILGFVLTIVMYQQTLNGYKEGILYAVMPVVGVWAICFMGRRTVRGAELLGKTLGFQDFLKKAEKSRLELLVEENPAYFYDILPYAYVLGVSDKWAKKFESIHMEQPNWYVGGYGNDPFTTYLFISHMNRCTNVMASSMIPPVPENTGGGSFGGGGGFTGGGVGGGGGGAW
ncbi:MAG: DUF2207 domain-containing protein [Anaerostipes sp.]|nr:DUF2207 domain-containing protein [Anaerostipes sp.]MDD4371779.1 DUF2207 domain-containing protein [Anaerostipes sp.]